MIEKLFALDNRTALVTGASSGLGRHFAHTLAQAGANIVVCARRIDKLESLVEQLRGEGNQAVAIKLDVNDSASVRHAFDVAQAAFGVVDVIINNAGIASTSNVLEQSEATWDDVLGTNLKGPYLVAQEGAKRLLQAGRGGSIVNIASILGERVAGGASAYAASKAGLIQLTKAMALELARHGIRVNALSPGYVATDLNSDFLASDAGQRLVTRIPQRRFARQEELDGALLLLASDAGSYITGAMLAVDGGHLVSSL